MPIRHGLYDRLIYEDEVNALVGLSDQRRALLDTPTAYDATGVAKALNAYGPSVLDDVKKARAQLLDRKGRLSDCMKNLGMRMPEAALRRRIQAICPVLTRP